MQRTHEELVVRRSKSECGTGNGVLCIYYDGSCPLCTAEINYYASRIEKSNLHLVDVSMADADLKSDLEPEAAMARFHVRKPDGELLSGAKAFVEVWRLTLGWTWVARLASIPGVTALMELSYQAFLKVRPAISKLAAIFGVQAENKLSIRRTKGAPDT